MYIIVETTSRAVICNREGDRIMFANSLLAHNHAVRFSALNTGMFCVVDLDSPIPARCRGVAWARWKVSHGHFLGGITTKDMIHL